MNISDYFFAIQYVYAHISVYISLVTATPNSI